ncbi:hypothetical protein AURDEDRAFT_170182 [Auricularia subglabra TFB-10046 SS5]|nr:hypothetical protein AURDEDRAFT_170182 [Auricularia subglabra TFB-10046 SS5]
MLATLPVPQLRDLWIKTPANRTCQAIPRLFAQSTVQGVSVGVTSSGLAALVLVVHPGESRSTKVVANAQRVYTRLEAFLTPFAWGITWLTISEYLWDNAVTGPPPALPALTLLSVCLASIDDYARAWQGRWFFGPWSAGVFTADPASRWALPSLREVRITSPPKDERSLEGTEECILSISLGDVARWIRDGIDVEPPARRLDTIVLSGVRIIDHDFCAAWDTVMALSHSLELCERPDALYHTSFADLDFKLRSSSISGDGNHFW